MASTTTTLATTGIFCLSLLRGRNRHNNNNNIKKATTSGISTHYLPLLRGRNRLNNNKKKHWQHLHLVYLPEVVVIDVTTTTTAKKLQHPQHPHLVYLCEVVVIDHEEVEGVVPPHVRVDAREDLIEWIHNKFHKPNFSKRARPVYSKVHCM